MATIAVQSEEGSGHLETIVGKLQERFEQEKANNPEGYIDAFELRFESHCLEVAQELGGEVDFVDGEVVFDLTPNTILRRQVEAAGPVR